MNGNERWQERVLWAHVFLAALIFIVAVTFVGWIQRNMGFDAALYTLGLLVATVLVGGSIYIGHRLGAGATLKGMEATADNLHEMGVTGKGLLNLLGKAYSAGSKQKQGMLADDPYTDQRMTHQQAALPTPSGYMLDAKTPDDQWQMDSQPTERDDTLFFG